MKVSKYLILIENDKSKILYVNTYTGNILSLNTEQHQLVQQLLNDINAFKSEYPNIYNIFVDKGFIIDDFRNEQEEIIFAKKEAVFLDREYQLFLHPTLDCNFNCWYCYEEHPKEKMSDETFTKIQRHLEYMSERISAFHLSWFGGEPLMYYYEILEPMSLFAKKLMNSKNIPFKNSITTNAYYIDKQMIQSFKSIDLKIFQITLDGDREKHNKVRQHYGQPTFDKIVQNIIDLCYEIPDVYITLRINYDNQTLKHNPEFLQIFPNEIRRKLHLDFQRVWQTFQHCTIENSQSEQTDDILKWMDYASDLGFDVIYTRLHAFKGYACYVDKYYHLEIDHLGKVYKCTAKGYSPEYEVGVLLDDGRIAYNRTWEAKRFAQLTVENDECLNCKFLPMCGGMCTQNFIENNKQHKCVLTLAEVPIEQALQRLYNEKKKEREKFYEQ